MKFKVKGYYNDNSVNRMIPFVCYIEAPSLYSAKLILIGKFGNNIVIDEDSCEVEITI